MKTTYKCEKCGISWTKNNIHRIFCLEVSTEFAMIKIVRSVRYVCKDCSKDFIKALVNFIREYFKEK